MYLRTPAVSALLVAASVIALSSGCGLADKIKGDDDKKKDPAAQQAAGGGGSTGGATGAPATQPGGNGTAPATGPATGKPGGDLDPKAFCNLLTPAELKGVLGSEITRTKNDESLRTCRYYEGQDTPVLTLQYFTHSARLGDTPESVVAKNSVAKYGKPITDLGAFPTLYVPGGGNYPAPSVPEVYFAKTHGDLIVDMHVTLTPDAKNLPRTQHIAIAKIIADKI